jgi:hypothetical protein
LFFRASLRSLWSPVVVLMGLVWGLLGVSILADPRIGSRVDVASVFIGLGVTSLGLAFAWGGFRLGVVRTPAGLRVRDLVGGTTYAAETIAGFSVGEHAHDLLPLQIVFPVLRMAEDDDVPVMSLAAYDILPGARRRVARAATTMAAWTGRPVLD